MRTAHVTFGTRDRLQASDTRYEHPDRHDQEPATDPAEQDQSCLAPLRTVLVGVLPLVRPPKEAARTLPEHLVLGLKIATSPTTKRITAIKMKNRPIPALRVALAPGSIRVRRSHPKGRTPVRRIPGGMSYRVAGLLLLLLARSLVEVAVLRTDDLAATCPLPRRTFPGALPRRTGVPSCKTARRLRQVLLVVWSGQQAVGDDLDQGLHDVSA